MARASKDLRTPHRLWMLAFVAAVLFVVSPPAAQRADSPAGPSTRFDLLITGGQVIDGTGNPWFSADVGIRGGTIAAIGRLHGAQAERTIDATGKFVVPGFIDLHSHADDNDFYSAAGIPPERHDQGTAGTLRDPNPRRRAAPNLVAQGVTTVVVNQDGSSPWPLRDQRALLDERGIGVNAVLLVGHNAVREQVMGKDFRRAATAAEIANMRPLVRQGLEEGAFGLSAALEYVPALWATTEELVALCEELVPFDGVYIQHERSSGAAPMWWKPSRDAAPPSTLLEAIKELVDIAERSGARVVATHLKARGTMYWGTSHAVIQMIERARARGVEIWGDQYPYNTSGSDGSVVLIPDWAIGFNQWGTVSGGQESKGRPDYAAALRKTLADPKGAANVRRDVAHEMEFRGGADNIVVFEYPDKQAIGKSLAELAAARRQTPVERAIALQLEGFPDRPGGARLRGFSFSEEDVKAYAARPWVATASDAGIALPEDGPDVHPRYYGTFLRKIRQYALNDHLISVEEAVRSATSLPAQILRLRDRGLIHEGYHADLAILDLERLRDRATFFEPHQFPEGVEYVLVNGRFTVDSGQLTWALPGTVLSRGTRPGADRALRQGHTAR